MTPARRDYDDPTLAIWRCDNLLVASWSDAPTATQVGIVGEHVMRLRETFGDDVGFVNVIVSGSVERFTKEARLAANELTRRYPNALCAAHVVLVDGLTGMLARAILRAMALVGQNAGPWKVFDSCDAAAPWIASHLDGRQPRSWSTVDVVALLRAASRRA